MSMSWAQLRRFLKHSHCEIKDEIPEEPKKQSKVNANKTIIDGHRFDSKSEALIYSELKIDPDVEILELQPRFVFYEPFYRSFTEKRKYWSGISYKSDFRIVERGVGWILEVKSKGTLAANKKSYPIRRQMLLSYLNNYPGVGFMEIIFDGNKREVKEY